MCIDVPLGKTTTFDEGLKDLGAFGNIAMGPVWKILNTAE